MRSALLCIFIILILPVVGEDVLRTNPLNSFHISVSDTDRTARDKSSTTTVRVPKSGRDRGKEQTNKDAGKDGDGDDDSGCFSSFVFHLIFGFPEDEKNSSFRPSDGPFAQSVDWSRFYVGGSVGAGFPLVDEGSEYNGSWNMRLIGSRIFENGFGLEAQFDYSRFGGTPEFDYVTTTTYTNGDRREVKEIPLETNLQSMSLAIGGRYWWLSRSTSANFISGWNVGLFVRYSRLAEEGRLKQQEFMNTVQVSELTHTVGRTFWIPSFGIDGSYFLTPSQSARWALNLTFGLDMTSRKPPRSLPLPLDWSTYKGQFYLGATVMYRWLDF